MDMDRYGKLYVEELRLRGKILYEKNQEKREEMKKHLDEVVAEMVTIEKELEAEWFKSQGIEKEDKAQ